MLNAAVLKARIKSRLASRRDRGLRQGANGDVPVWYTHDGEQFRNERDAGEIVKLRHCGWFTDNDDAFESVIGIVASLPHGRFIAGYRWTSNDERVYFGDVFDNERDAAHAADGHAEWFADRQREHSERFSAMVAAEEYAEAVEHDTDMAIQARNVSARHREHARDRIEELRAAREEVQLATDEYNRA